ncbi:MAG TPA: hypothetical protein VEL75_06165 [Candidatus Methylomirabilis sp.]|jgi:hypothetical protein|nr:hypothetical protein [Candidatus Methylomirabilis sp.]
MRTVDDIPAASVQGFRLVGQPGDVAPASGAYRCLICGAMLWRLSKGRRFPDCPSFNCPTTWMWARA